MAIVKLKSTVFGVTGVSGYTEPQSSSRDGINHTVSGRVTNAATDNTGSLYLLAQIPWAAILKPTTAFLTMNWGFAQAVIGVDEAPTGLLNAAKGASGTGQAPITIFGATWNKPLWAQVGLAFMPTDKGYANLYAKAVADAAGAGTMDFQIDYALYL